jgi:orotate phosphoribosyltransferase
VTDVQAKTLPAAEARARLKAMIAARCMKRGQFKLASGATSTWYFDMKPALMDPEGSYLVARLMLDLLANEKVDAVGGLAMGAVPIAASVCTLSHGYGAKPLAAFFVRKEPKERGTEKLIEGNLAPGMTAVVLEDVTTTGGSSMKAVAAVRAFGCKVDTILSVLDRQEGAEENLKKEGLRLISLFRRDDFA